MKNFIAALFISQPSEWINFNCFVVRLLNRPEIAAGFLQLHLSKIHVNNSIRVDVPEP